MEPENHPLEKGDSFWKPSFSGSMLNFGGVIIIAGQLKLLWSSQDLKPQKVAFWKGNGIPFFESNQGW